MNPTYIVGESPWIQLLRDNILQVAGFTSNVLITGPSGTGKELIARAIHQHSPRSAGPFVPVDCTSLSGELFASHLFGHVKGAFTGAEHQRLGCFRVADGGTLLLDEIGELSLEMQSKLLRTIQERTVVPLGSDEPMPVDVRVIAATNRNLLTEVHAGRFRLDLYYRLNVVSFETLPLCQRRQDIEPLANHFLAKLAVNHGFPPLRLAPAAIAAMEAYCWPGNVRELQNVLERAAIFATGGQIDAAAIPRDNAKESPRPASDAVVGNAPAADNSPWSTLADIECRHIRDTLIHTHNNQSLAAKLLNIDRASLARKISRYGILIPDARPGRPRKLRADWGIMPQQTPID